MEKDIGKAFIFRYMSPTMAATYTAYVNNTVMDMYSAILPNIDIHTGMNVHHTSVICLAFTV